MLFSLLKILQLLVGKFETFIIKLKAGFTELPNFKKIHRRKLEKQGTKKLPINLQNPDFTTARVKTIHALHPRNRATARAHKE